jgi:aryl-alcohol dehydrogenase-like predicted oxidoreductase
MADAKAKGLTPFSVYQGRWNAANRDMEAEIIPMCQDQGMGIMPWAALGGGQLLSSEQRRKLEANSQLAGRQKIINEKNIQVSEALEKLASEKKTTLQAIALAYLLSQTPYVTPIVGVQSVAHVKAMPEALNIALSDNDLKAIHEASPFEPLFPMNFLFNFRGDQPYNLKLTATDCQQYQMAARIGGPPKQRPY